LQQAQIKDYSAEMHVVMQPDGRPGLGLSMDPRSEMTLAYNDSDSKWNAEKLQKFDEATKSYTDFTLAEDEELNTETLNALKTALDDLQIVDVVRKPQGLSNDLKAGADFMNNVEALQNLVSKGFIPARAPGGSTAEELISSDGEVIATMKDGTEYVLRFGNLTNVGTEGAQSDPATEAGADAAAKANNDGGVHRYLFVMARFNEGAVKQPETQDLPELPAQSEDAAVDKPAAESEATASQDTESTVDTATDDAAAETTEASAPEKSDSEEPAEDAKADEAAKTDEAAPAAEGETKPAGDKEAEVKNIIAERTRIEQENKRKLDEYQQALEKGRKNVKDLNLRFGDWYFVVADDVFKKIRLSRDNVIKKKEKKADAATATPATGETPPATTPGTVPGLPPIPGTGE
jgi:hypothetical protein